MKCEEIGNRMMDVLYGEALDSRECFAFFRHLDECAGCRREYDGLVETRRALGEWQVEDLPSDALQSVTQEWEKQPPASARKASASLWTWVQRSAAALLMALGLWTLLAQAGLAPSPRGGADAALTSAQMQERVEERAARLMAEELYSMRMKLQGDLEDLKSHLRYVEESSDQRNEMLEKLQEQNERVSSGT